jgi:hypothetical protein
MFPAAPIILASCREIGRRALLVSGTARPGCRVAPSGPGPLPLGRPGKVQRRLQAEGTRDDKSPLYAGEQLSAGDETAAAGRPNPRPQSNAERAGSV